MDIRCPKCGEEWDIAEFHDIPGIAYKEAIKSFKTIGCAVFRTSHAEVKDKTAAMKACILYDLLGDDIDACASILAE